METKDYQFFHIYLRGNQRQDFLFKKEDYINLINRLALAAYYTKTMIWAMKILSNHFHLVVETMDRGAFMHYFRLSLTQWFNKENGVDGTIGKRHYGFGNIVHPTIDGGEDLRDAIAYTLRNSKKHGIQEDFYNYPYSSIGSYFKELVDVEAFHKTSMPLYFPKNVVVPSSLRISKKGVIYLRDFINVKGVEELFGTEERFHSVLSRPSNREIRNAEYTNNTGKNKQTENSIRNNIKNDSIRRRGQRAKQPITDIKISETVLSNMNMLTDEKGLFPISIPQMSTQNKYFMADYIRKIYPQSSTSQIARVLLLPETTLRRHFTSNTRASIRQNKSESVEN